MSAPYRTPSPPAQKRDLRLFSAEPAPWARWEMAVSRSPFFPHERYGFVRWSWVAQIIGRWYVWRHPLASVAVRRCTAAQL